jgi:DNA-directed RNA polymerase specialized sigma24 family protein
MSYRDVAEHLELPEGTVKSRIRSGLQHIRVIFESQMPAEAEAEASLPPDRGRQWATTGNAEFKMQTG